MNSNNIRQSEFQKIHKLTAVEVAELRRTHLTEQTDWHAEGRAIYWTNEAAERVAKVLASGEKPPEVAAMVTEEAQENTDISGVDTAPDAPAEVEVEAEVATKSIPNKLTVRVLKRARNYNYVYADLEGERISVLIGKKSRKSIVGKKINVIATQIDGEFRYTHVQ